VIVREKQIPNVSFQLPCGCRQSYHGGPAILFENRLAPADRAQNPAVMAFTRFQADNIMRRLVREDGKTVAGAGNNPDEAE
jgi:hypothetical protein